MLRQHPKNLDAYKDPVELEPFTHSASFRKRKGSQQSEYDLAFRIAYALGFIVITLYSVNQVKTINVPLSTKQTFVPLFWVYLLLHLISIPFLHLNIISCLFAFALLFSFRMIQSMLTGVVIVWIVFCSLGSVISFAITYKTWDRRYLFSFIAFCFFIEWQQLHSLNSQASQNYQNFIMNLPPNFDVHEYLEIQTPNVNHLDDYMFQRTKRIHDQYMSSRRTEFRIEKSKCFMYNFFEQHNIGHVPVLAQFESKDKFWSWLQKDNTQFPLIVKFCHLTQGTQAWKGFKEVHGNTFFLKNRDSLELDLFKRWIDAGWATIPEDPGRSWETNMKEPLKALKPGLFVQPAWHFFPDTSQPLEIKVFVIWGKVFFMRFETGFPDWGGGNARVDRFYVLPSIDLKVRDNTNMLLKYSTGDVPFFNKIPNFEDHLRAVIKLAELDAQTLKADFFRVDIFLNPDDPSAPAINEHSLLEISNFMNENHKYGTMLLQMGYSSSKLRVCQASSNIEQMAWTDLQCNPKH